MTEAEWTIHHDLVAMLDALEIAREESRPKLQIFACACCYRVLPLGQTEGNREILEAAERLMEARLSDEAADTQNEWRAASREFSGCPRSTVEKACHAAWRSVYHFGPIRGVGYAPTLLSDVSMAVNACRVAAGNSQEAIAQWGLFWCIFGPLDGRGFVTANLLSWNGGVVRHLAKAIDEELDFDSLPILADALTEAGADWDELIQHCRSEGPHVRQCWALNRILGREGDSSHPPD